MEVDHSVTYVTSYYFSFPPFMLCPKLNKTTTSKMRHNNKLFSKNKTKTEHLRVYNHVKKRKVKAAPASPPLRKVCQ